MNESDHNLEVGFMLELDMAKSVLGALVKSEIQSSQEGMDEYESVLKRDGKKSILDLFPSGTFPPTRVWNRLIRWGITTKSQLSELSLTDIKYDRGVGSGSMGVIHAMQQVAQIELKMGGRV